MSAAKPKRDVLSRSLKETGSKPKTRAIKNDLLKLKPLNSVVSPSEQLEMLLQAVGYQPAFSELEAEDVVMLSPRMMVVDFEIGEQITVRGELTSWIGFLVKGAMAAVEGGKETESYQATSLSLLCVKGRHTRIAHLHIATHTTQLSSARIDPRKIQAMKHGVCAFQVGSIIGTDVLFGSEPRQQDIQGQTVGYLAIMTLQTLVSLCSDSPQLATSLIRALGKIHLSRLAFNPRIHKPLEWNATADDVADPMQSWLDSNFKPYELGEEGGKELLNLMSFHRFNEGEGLLDRCSSDDFVFFLVVGHLQLSVNGTNVQRIGPGAVVWGARYFKVQLLTYDVVGESAGILAGISYKEIEHMASSNVILMLAFLRIIGSDASKGCSRWLGPRHTAPILEERVLQSKMAITPQGETFYKQKLKQQATDSDEPRQPPVRDDNTSAISKTLFMDLSCLSDIAQELHGVEEDDDEPTSTAKSLRRKIAARLSLAAHRDNARLQKLVSSHQKLEIEVTQLKKLNADLLTMLEKERSRLRTVNVAELRAELRADIQNESRNMGDDPSTLTEESIASSVAEKRESSSFNSQEMAMLREANAQLREELERTKQAGHVEDVHKMQVTLDLYLTRIHELQKEQADADLLRRELDRAKLAIARSYDDRKVEVQKAVEHKMTMILKLEGQLEAEKNAWKIAKDELEKRLEGSQIALKQSIVRYGSLRQEFDLSEHLLAEELFVVERTNSQLTRDLRLMRIATKCMGVGYLLKNAIKDRKMHHMNELFDLALLSHQEKLSKAARQNEAELTSLNEEVRELRKQRTEREAVVVALTSETDVLQTQCSDLRKMLHEQKLHADVAEAELGKLKIASRLQFAQLEKQAGIEAARVQVLRKKLAASTSEANGIRSSLVRHLEVEQAYGGLLRTAGPAKSSVNAISYRGGFGSLSRSVGQFPSAETLPNVPNQLQSSRSSSSCLRAW